MSKLRRIAEVGDGSYEQMEQQNASSPNTESSLQAAKRRKKKYVVAGKQQPVVDESQKWQALKGALRVEQKKFDPEDYSSYDTSGRSIRRSHTEMVEDETPYDTTTNIRSAMHMYSDPMQELKESLKEQAVNDALMKGGALAKELRELEKTQNWEQEAQLWAQARLKGRNGENISGSDSRGGIVKTAEENVSASRFGQLDIEAAEQREIERQEREENMRQRHRSIKDSRIDVTKEQKIAQWQNDDNIRSQSIQSKMKNSNLFNKLAEITNS